MSVEEPGVQPHRAEVRRRRSPKGEARRMQILDAGMRIFSRDGYQSAAIAAVAEEVGLSLPGLLHHFPSKVDLLLAILERRDIEGMAVIGTDGPDWRATLQKLCVLNRHNATIPGVVRAFSILNAESLVDEHPAGEWFRKRSDMVKAQFERVIRAGIAAGEIRGDVYPSLIATQIIALMDGLQILWLRAPDSVDIVACFDDFVARLIEGIERR
jgi:AcrR family transcriptional regulator